MKKKKQRWQQQRQKEAIISIVAVLLRTSFRTMTSMHLYDRLNISVFRQAAAYYQCVRYFFSCVSHSIDRLNYMQ